MISRREQSYNSFVCECSTKPEISQRILELRTKIHQQDYLDNAILRIAQIVSKQLVDEREELYFNE